MARTVRDTKLESRTARGALKASGKPYWRAIEEGLHLGYRKGRTTGKWVLRVHVGGAKAYETETIATADDTIDADGDIVLTFQQAQAEARKRFIALRRAAAGLPAEGGPYTVRAAIEDYLTWIEAEGRKSVKDARVRAAAMILPRLGGVECAKLTSKMIRDWRDAVAAEPARLRTKKGKQQRHRQMAEDEDPEIVARRRKATSNRTLTILKAALNHAWRERRVASDEAWRAVQPFREADAARSRYLTADECRRIINAADAEFRPLVVAALQTGARFGELAALTVRDFNPDSGTLHIRKSKSGKERDIVLTDEGTTFFRGLAAGRATADRMLVKANGERWGASHQSRPMRDACKHARIDPPVSFHTLRHTWASLAVMAGMPLMVVARNLGHADTRMVEKHYGHLAKSWIAEAVRAAAPRFGIEAGNVRAIGEVR